MPIVSHTLETDVQPNGASHNVLRMYDQDGREYMQTYWAPAGFDHQTKVNITISETDEQLKQNEFESIFGRD